MLYQRNPPDAFYDLTLHHIAMRGNIFISMLRHTGRHASSLFLG